MTALITKVFANPSVPQKSPFETEAVLLRDIDSVMELDRSDVFCHELISSPGKTSVAEELITNLSLHDAVSLAIKNHLQTRTARARVEEARGLKWQSASPLLPHVDAGISQKRTGRENLEALGFKGGGLIGPFNTFDARFQLTQSVLDLSAFARYLAGRNDYRIAEYREVLTEQKVTVMTTLAYLEALRAFGEYKAAQADYALAVRLFSQAENQQKAGISTGVDVARADTRVAEENFRVAQAVAVLHDAFLTMQRLTGLLYTSQIRLVNTLRFFEEPVFSMDEAIGIAREERLELKIARESVRASKHELSAARAEVLPKVAFSGNAGLSGITPDDHDRFVGEGMLVARMPIFQGGEIAGQIKSASSRRTQEEIMRDDLVRQVEEDVHMSLWAVETSFEQVKAAGKTVLLARRELEMARHRFTEGVGDNVEVVSAQTKVAQAKEVYLSALTQYHTSRINFYFAMGKTEAFSLSPALNAGTKGGQKEMPS
ncbi:TolC family protein [Omnitrophica bacterium]|nr:TolC family protein [Candidatus Omnitrophota bacterium]